MRVTAVVVNWNGADHLPGCLDALLAQDHDELDVLVVDNASSDGSRQVLSRYGDRIRVRWNATNRGFAGGVNDGLTETSAAAVLVVNPDVRCASTYVSRAVAALRADPRRGAVQGKLLRTEPAPSGDPVIDTTGHIAFRTRLFRNRGEGEVDRGQWEDPGEVFGVSGACALWRRQMLDDVALRPSGGRGPVEILDEDLFAYFEDVDLDWRAQLRGWSAWYQPDAVAHHERGGAGPRRTAVVERLNFVNRLAVVIKDDDPRALLAAAPAVALATALKALELVLTKPAAALAAARALPGALRAARTKRPLVHDRATVPSRAVIDRWFGSFDWGGWIRTWWRRVRSVPLGS